MNKTALLLAALVALSGAAAHADELYAPGAMQSSAQPTVTRAAVRQELARARAAGELKFGDVDYPQAYAATTARTRAEVRDETRADMLAARKAGHTTERTGD